tara:strand:- start:40 stop:318 length:279 start_codon:yes stop_codon:yes gene_type:complete
MFIVELKDTTLHKKQNEIFTNNNRQNLPRSTVSLFAQFLSLYAHLFPVYDRSCAKARLSEGGMVGVKALFALPSLGRPWYRSCPMRLLEMPI